jgi:hypothetical protein
VPGDTGANRYDLTSGVIPSVEGAHVFLSFAVRLIIEVVSATEHRATQDRRGGGV